MLVCLAVFPMDALSSVHASVCVCQGVSPTWFCNLFYLGCSLFAPWDSLSDYVHPEIASLAFQASDWAGAFWVWFVIGYLCWVSVQE